MARKKKVKEKQTVVSVQAVKPKVVTPQCPVCHKQMVKTFTKSINHGTHIATSAVFRCKMDKTKQVIKGKI